MINWLYKWHYKGLLERGQGPSRMVERKIGMAKGWSSSMHVIYWMNMSWKPSFFNEWTCKNQSRCSNVESTSDREFSWVCTLWIPIVNGASFQFLYQNTEMPSRVKRTHIYWCSGIHFIILSCFSIIFWIFSFYFFSPVNWLYTFNAMKLNQGIYKKY